MSKIDLSRQFARNLWANKRRKELEATISYFFEKKPIELVGEIATDRLSWQLQLRLKEQPPLDDWGFMFSEVVHHLRASLDNAVFAIAVGLKSLTEKEKRDLTFPIVEDKGNWPLAQKRISCLPSEYVSAIELLQPFNHPNRNDKNTIDALSLLRDLNDLDKHRIHFTPGNKLNLDNIQNMMEFETEQDAKDDGAPEVSFYEPEFKNGHTILNQRTKHRIQKIRGRVEFNASAQILLPSGETASVSQVLINVRQGCHIVLDHLQSI
ncbi:MAG: hypothetical protein HYY50_04995 [Candidatus Kerfeldbacteria bacterium]|nr:hypothetical protein [Candidatus Kerfeldbacteria bacterium]